MKKGRKKILFIIPTLAYGGSENVFALIVNNIDQTLFEPILVVLNHDESQRPIDPSIKVIKLSIVRVRYAALKILRIVKQEKPDIVCSTLSHLNQYLSFFKLFVSPSIKFIARESTVVSINNQIQSFPKLSNFIVSKMYKNFDVIICQSTDMFNDLMHVYKLDSSKLKIINNPVDIDTIQIKSKIDKVPSKLKPYRFISVAGLENPKGIDRALQALAIVKESLDFEYLIIGNGSKKDGLIALSHELGLSNNVTFLGWQKNPFNWMVSADLFILPSRFEGFPNVLNEAAALGLPAVAFNCSGGINEILLPEVTGLVVPNDDIKALAEAIIRATKLSFNKESIQQNIKSRFGLNKILEQYQRVFMDALTLDSVTIR